MNSIIEKLIDSIKRNKKKIIKRASIFGAIVVGISLAGTIGLYSIAKLNINYTEEQAKEIALKLVPGEVVRIRKNLDLDNFTFEYDIKIKDTNNVLREVNVDANLGVITDADMYND